MKNDLFRRCLAGLLALCLSALACNLPSPPVATQILPDEQVVSTPSLVAPTADAPQQEYPPTPTLTIPPPDPTAAYRPVVERAECAFPVPVGTSPECGYLIVPENRARADSALLRLHVAVFRSASSSPAPDPVVHLAGGPGSSSLDVAEYLFQVGLGGVLEQRDLILFDQRGTGYSQPQLDCPEREGRTAELLEGNFSPEQERQIIVDAFQRCHDRLIAEGRDLSAYTSAASAADVEDLRQALGYPQFNLYGVSYGTRLALTVMRDYPQAVRSAVLDSTYPPQVHLYTMLAPNAERAFNVLFDRCAADPVCSATYPDLRGVFYRLVDQLNVRPVPVSVGYAGVEHTVRLTGNLLVDVLFVGLYNPSVARRMPEMIYGIRNGDYSLLRQRLALYFDFSAALGMTMAVQCNEEIPFSPGEEAFTMAEGVAPQIANFFPQNVQPLFHACSIWNPGTLDPRENQPVSSDVPALILAGEFDPITPPEWGRMAAGTLANGLFFEFPGNGHWVTRSSACALSMALTFWNDPGIAPDASCIQPVAGMDF